MKVKYYEIILKKDNLFLIILFLGFFIISKENNCPDNQINISPTICKPIEDILENEELDLSSNNFGYLQSQKDINKNNYEIQALKLDNYYLQSGDISKSKLYISEKCIKAMENKYQFDRSNAISIFVSDRNKLNKYNISENYFVIRNIGGTINIMNSQRFDFSICHEDPILLDLKINIDNLKYDTNDNTQINIDRIMYAKKLKIDLFDPNSKFLNDICFKFTSEIGTDVTLETRYSDYYQNIILCDENKNAHYIGFNYSTEDKMLSYRCAFGFYGNIKEKKSYIENIDSKMNMVFSNSNFKVITCYKEILNLRILIYNYGGIICILVFFIQIILYIEYCCKGIKPLQEKIDNMFNKTPVRNNTDPNKDNHNGLSERYDIKQNNEINNENPIKNDNNLNEIQIKKKKKKKKRNSVINPPKKKIKNKNKKLFSIS